MGGTALVVGTPAILTALGFTGTGVAAGTIAARIMALYAGSVPTGSLFAVLQSVGAAGFSVAGKMGLAIIGGAAGFEFADYKCICENDGSA